MRIKFRHLITINLVLILGLVACSEGQPSKESGTMAETPDGKYLGVAYTLTDKESKRYYLIEIYRTTKEWRANRPAPVDTLYREDPKTGEINEDDYELIRPEEEFPLSDFKLLRNFRIYPPEEEPKTDFYKGIGSRAGGLHWESDPLVLNVAFFGAILRLSPVDRYEY